MGPTHECPKCQSVQFLTVVQVDPDTREISAYALDVKCVMCGSLLKMVCPVDQPVLRELPEDEE